MSIQIKFRKKSRSLSQLQSTELNHYLDYDWGNNVLNGIAFDKSTNTFLVTGKEWEKIYRIELDY